MADMAEAASKIAEKSDAEKAPSSGGLMSFSDKGLCPDLSVTQVCTILEMRYGRWF
jgi:hypothetical protein